MNEVLMYVLHQLETLRVINGDINQHGQYLLQSLP